MSAQNTRPLDVEYRDAAGRLIGAAMVDTAGYDKLAYLTTRIGNRLSGSTGLERAIAWVAEQMKAGGFENIRTQPVKVPHWVRGNESAEVVAPVRRTLNMLGLGRSVATPSSAGITAPVVVVGNFDELERLGAEVGRHVAAIEMDEGAERPIGFGIEAKDNAARVQNAHAARREIARLLDGIGAGAMEAGGGATDIGPLMRAGVPGFGLLTVNEHYFDWHHTNADTLGKIDLQDFRKCIASLAVLGYVLADMPERL